MSNINALTISSFFIKKGVSPLKLQKLLYYSQVWFFVRYGKTLFNDRISGWIYGPVVNDVWHEFKFIKKGNEIPTNRSRGNKIDNDIVLSHLDEIWKVYGHFSASELVDLTHKDLPWKESRQDLSYNQPSNNQVLINDETTSYFKLDSSNCIPKVESTVYYGYYSNF